MTGEEHSSRKRLTTHGLTEGAIQAALVALFALATRYLPVVGAATAFLVPLPLTVLVIRQGLRPGILAAVVAGTIAALVAGPIAGAGLLITFAPFGLIVGAGVRAHRSAPAILAMAAAASVVSLTASLALTLALSGVNPYHTMIQAMQEGQATALGLYGRIGVDPEWVESTNRQMRQVLDLLPKMIPALLVIGGVFMAWINYQVARLVLRRLNLPLPALPPMSSWRIPSYVLWLLPAAALLAAAGVARPVVPLSDHARSLFVEPAQPLPAAIGFNVLALVQMAFAVQGLLVAWVLLGRYIAAPAMRVVVLLIAFFNPLLGYAITLLGMTDSIFRWRERFGTRRAIGRPEVAEAHP